jgi:hypothetical protein
MKKTFLLFVLFFFTWNITVSQELRRKGFFGVTGVDMNDSISSSLGLNSMKGYLVKTILPNSTAALFDLKEKDIVVKISGQEITGAKNVSAIFKNLREGDDIGINIIREKDLITLKGKVAPKPFEKYDNSEVIYGQTPFKGGYLRTIITKPKKEGRHPAIFFIPGYTCMTMDNLGLHPYGQLFKGLVDKGYVLMRVEKPGMGDCDGTPDCIETDLNTEIEAFEKGYEKMLEYDFVDKENIVVMGHSLGGIEAPIISQKYNPKGVLAYGTGVKTWYEYLLEMFRFQNPLNGISYIENEKHIQAMIPLLYKYLIEKKTPAELSVNADYKKMMETDMEFDGGTHIWTRDYHYWQQIQDINLTDYWAGIKSNVLVIWGEFDFEAFSRFDHELIIEIVNQNNPKMGNFLVLEKTDHAFSIVDSYKQDADLMKSGQYSKYIRENFNGKLIDEIDKWIKSIVK